MTKLEKLCIKWLNENFNPMETFHMEKYPDYIFHMKDGKCILQHNTKNGYVYVSYREIWKFFESFFSMTNQQIKDITKIWVEEHYKIGVKSTGTRFLLELLAVEEHYKIGVKSTQEFGWRQQKEVDEHYKVGVTKTTTLDKTQQEYSVEEHYKMGEISTIELMAMQPYMVEEHYKVGEISTTKFKKRKTICQVEEHYQEIQTTNNQK